MTSLLDADEPAYEVLPCDEHYERVVIGEPHRATLTVYRRDISRALAAETGIAADQIGDGATLLNKLSAGYNHSFARVSFPLSIGLERSCKLALQVNARLTNGAFLGQAEMRAFGHKLKDSLIAVDEMNKRRGNNEAMPDHEVHRGLITVLTDFATNGRYHHLDYLAGREGTNDPAKQWWDDVIAPILRRHYPAERRRLNEAIAHGLGTVVDGLSAVLHTHVSGGAIHSMVDGMKARSQAEAAIPWARMYTLQIARWLTGTFSSLSAAAHRAGTVEIPDMQDFFAHFNNDDAYLRSRKVWLLDAGENIKALYSYPATPSPASPCGPTPT